MANKNYNLDFDKSMNAAHISANLDNFEAGRTGFFTLTFKDYDGNDLHISDTSEDTDYTNIAITDENEILKLSVAAVDVPYFTVNSLEYRIGNDVIHFAGMPTFSGGSFTVHDYVGLDTKGVLYKWLCKAYDPMTRKTGRMSDYKKIGILTEYTADYTAVRRWYMYGIWVNELSDNGFDRSNDSANDIKVGFIYDYAYQEKDITEVVNA